MNKSKNNQKRRNAMRNAVAHKSSRNQTNALSTWRNIHQQEKQEQQAQQVQQEEVSESMYNRMRRRRKEGRSQTELYVPGSSGVGQSKAGKSMGKRGGYKKKYNWKKTSLNFETNNW